jgi:hypothetical protein
MIKIYYFIIGLLWLSLLIHFTMLFIPISSNVSSGIHFEKRHVENAEKLATCGRRPTANDIYTLSTYWQVMKASNALFYLHSAYYDERMLLKGSSFVRILLLSSKYDISDQQLFCQLWYENSNEIVLARVDEKQLLWKKQWTQNENDSSPPFILSCKIPFKGIPSHVSLVEHPCEHSNNLIKVNHVKNLNYGHKGDFLVCVRGMHFEYDISSRLVEWIEIMKALRVDKINFHVINIPNNMMRVLKYYENEGIVKIKELKFPETIHDNAIQSYQNELIAYHECLYENMNLYNLIVPLDIDEIILPTHEDDSTWRDLLKRAVNNRRYKYDAYSMPNFYFLTNNSRNHNIGDLHYMSNVYRTESSSSKGNNVKSFMLTERVLAIHNHMPLVCLDSDKCKIHFIDKNNGQLSHYRESCNGKTEHEEIECKELMMSLVKDIRLWKFKKDVVANHRRVLRALNLNQMNY